MTISLVSDITLKSSQVVWLTNAIQNTIHSLVNSHISMPGGQFSHFWDKMSLSRDTRVNSGTILAIPGRLASLASIACRLSQSSISLCVTILVLLIHAFVKFMLIACCGCLWFFCKEVDNVCITANLHVRVHTIMSGYLQNPNHNCSPTTENSSSLHLNCEQVSVSTSRSWGALKTHWSFSLILDGLANASVSVLVSRVSDLVSVLDSYVVCISLQKHCRVTCWIADEPEFYKWALMSYIMPKCPIIIQLITGL